MSQDNESAVLKDRTNALLQRFKGHNFAAAQLKNSVTVRPAHSQHGMDMTSMSGVSDAGLVVDPDDAGKVSEDLVAFKGDISRLKFAYLESHVKSDFTAHLLDPAGFSPPSLEENTQSERELVESKQTLRALKAQAGVLEGQIRSQASILDKRMQKASADVKTAESLMEECDRMEIELETLRRKRTPEERITIDEANALCDNQIEQLQTLADEVSAAKTKIHETKTTIASSKRAIEKLGSTRSALVKEDENRKANGTKDEKIEATCRSFLSASALYSALLGIKSAQSAGRPPSELRLIYEARAMGSAEPSETQALSLHLGDDGSVIGAELLESAIDIQDIVGACLPAQDIRSLVEHVRARFDNA